MMKDKNIGKVVNFLTLATMVVFAITVGIFLPLIGEMMFAWLAGHSSADTSHALVPLFLSAMTGWVITLLARGRDAMAFAIAFNLTLSGYFYAGYNAGSDAHHLVWLIHNVAIVLMVTARIVIDFQEGTRKRVSKKSF